MTENKLTKNKLIDSIAYRLLDFGDGQKLESFGSTIVLRDTPSVPPSNSIPVENYKNIRIGQVGDSVLNSTALSSKFGEINLVYQSRTAVSGGIKYGTEMPRRAIANRGHWIGTAPEPWILPVGPWSMLLKTTPAGQVGIFPEQVVNWQWALNQSNELQGMRALNLFAYTGAMTLALLNAGASVTHVDSAANTIKWARQNAEISSLSQAPARWICEHAAKFVQREVKRGAKYDILIADPPSFGKGPKGEQWQIYRDFEDLIRNLAKLCNGRPHGLIVSCHTPGIDHRDLFQMTSRHFDFDQGVPRSFPLDLISSNGKVLHCGHCFRFSKEK